MVHQQNKTKGKIADKASTKNFEATSIGCTGFSRFIEEFVVQSSRTLETWNFKMCWA